MAGLLNAYTRRMPHAGIRGRVWIGDDGIPLVDSGTEWTNPSAPGAGNELFVNANHGSDANTGDSWDAPFFTMAKAFSVLKSGNVINVVGKVKEQLSTPVRVFDVTIRGAGNRPRHEDTAPDPVGGVSTATWAMPGSGGSNTTPLLIVQQQGWRLENFVMAGPTTAACVQLLRNGGAADAERDASHFESVGVRYASGRDGIEQSGGCYNVGLFDNWFHDLTGYAVKNTAGAGIAAPYRWQIVGNDFDGCANLMGVWAAHAFRFMGNTVHEITTNYLDFSTGSHNIVVGNYFDVASADFDPTGKVAGSATDVWSNTLLNAIETGQPAD